ncbi:MAG: flavodoxin family protein [Bacilli bacterium]|nr:flavodoxin family protein [Bacilli bacterium]
MKVVLVNGSPHKNGNTNLALEEISKVLEKNGIETEIFWIGNKPISGCIGCGKCIGKGKCVFDDVVNEFIDKYIDCDGFIFGAPVHYASINGAMACFMDRLFYGKAALFKGKVGASVAVCRRAGGVEAFDRLNKYLTYSSMVVISSNYWNGVFGNGDKADASEDFEGMQTMRILGENMSWILNCIEEGKKAGLEFPKLEKKVFTNYIR